MLFRILFLIDSIFLRKTQPLLSNLAILFGLFTSVSCTSTETSIHHEWQQEIEQDMNYAIQELRRLDSECRKQILANPFRYIAPYKMLPWKQEMQHKLAMLFGTHLVELHKKVKQSSELPELRTASHLDEQFLLIMEAYHSIKKRAR